MLLRVSVGEVDQEVADFWTNIQEQSLDEQRDTLGLSGRRRRPAKKRRRKADSSS